MIFRRAGHYLYVGSALNGLDSRPMRHLEGRRLHWHADYLLREIELRGAWNIECERRLECEIAQGMRAGLEMPVKGFGA